MCTGCLMRVNGESASREYLDDILNPHQIIISKMKDFNKALLQFQTNSDKEYRGVVDKFRKKTIRLQKEFAKSINILHEGVSEVSEQLKEKKS